MGPKELGPKELEGLPQEEEEVGFPMEAPFPQQVELLEEEQQAARLLQEEPAVEKHIELEDQG